MMLSSMGAETTENCPQVLSKPYYASVLVEKQFQQIQPMVAILGLFKLLVPKVEITF
jgi:hypothetical protein